MMEKEYRIQKVSEDKIEVVRNSKNTYLTKEEAERFIENAWHGETPPRLVYITVIGYHSHSVSKYLTLNICGKVTSIEEYE